MNPNLPPPHDHERPKRAVILRAVALAGALSVLGMTLARADLHGAATLIAQTGPAVLIGLLPFAVMMGIDALVQRTLLARLGQRARYLSLYFVRLVTEALSTSLPAGVVFAESVGPVLLKQNCGVSIDAAIVANATKRWLTIRAHALYIALSAVLGYAVLTRVSATLWSGQWLVFVVVGLSIALGGASVAIGAVLAGRAWPQRMAKWLSALPIERLRTWLDAKSQSLVAIDDRFSCLTRAKGTLWVATAMLLSSWMIESFETWLILRLLGARLAFSDVIAFEAGLALLRSAVFFVPAGLGVQDLGYVAFLGALDLPGAAALGAAFVVLKRAKEALWMAVGWMLASAFAFARARAESRPVTLPEEALS